MATMSSWGRDVLREICGVGVGVESDHGFTEIVCPFKNLWSDIEYEGVRFPAAKNLDTMDVNIVEK